MPRYSSRQNDRQATEPDRPQNKSKGIAAGLQSCEGSSTALCFPFLLETMTQMRTEPYMYLQISLVIFPIIPLALISIITGVFHGMTLVEFVALM